MICHLLVSGLAPLKSIGPNILETISVPALETLLARGTTRRIGNASIESWLAGAFGLQQAGEPALAPYAVRGEGIDPGQHGWLCADPVHLYFSSEKVMLADSSRFSISENDAGQMVQALNAHFSDKSVTFLAPAPDRWYARTSRTPRIVTIPTSEVAGHEVATRLPTGEEQTYWRSILNEAQMVLHGHPCNEQREQRGEVSINSIWLWGAGNIALPSSRSPYDCIWSDHPLAKGLGLLGDATTRSLPASGRAVLDASAPADAKHLVVWSLTPHLTSGDASAGGEALAGLEQFWIAPLLSGVREGSVNGLAVHAVGAGNGWTLEFDRKDRLRWWRRRNRFFDDQV